MTQDKKFNTNIKEKDKGVVEIEARIPVDVMEKHRKKVLDGLRKDFEAPGFRKGNVPDDIIAQKIGENKILEDTANSALQEVYPQIVKEEELRVMSSPQVNITKLAQGNPLDFKATVGTVPEFKLPDYKKIAEEALKKEEEEQEVTEEEINNLIEEVIKMKSQGQEKKPKLTDEFVQSIGSFKDVGDFKEKVKENIKSEKKMSAQKKKRGEFAKKTIEATDLEIPEITITGELQAIMSKVQEDLAKKKMTIEDYLKQIGKDEKQFVQEYKDYISRQLKTKLILEKIAKEENIEVSDEEVAIQAQMLKSRYPEINPEEEGAKEYVRSMITNERVLQKLEGKEIPPSKENKKEDK